MTSTVPAKSQPLHNFALPHLKWKKNHHSNNHHRGRKLSDSSSSPSRIDSPLGHSVHESPIRNDSVSVPESSKRSLNGSISFVSEKKEMRSKIVLKFPKKNRGEESQKVDEVQEEGNQEGSEEPVPKTWNLRPRKPIQKSNNNPSGVQFKAEDNNKAQLSQRTLIRPEAAEVNGAEKKGKRVRFSISLSKEEIEEDIFSLTGSKPARRPRKRTKSVQRQLDNLFPGAWLASITPDSYKVSENPLKG